MIIAKVPTIMKRSITDKLFSYNKVHDLHLGSSWESELVLLLLLFLSKWLLSQLVDEATLNFDESQYAVKNKTKCEYLCGGKYIAAMYSVWVHLCCLEISARLLTLQPLV